MTGRGSIGHLRSQLCNRPTNWLSTHDDETLMTGSCRDATVIDAAPTEAA